MDLFESEGIKISCQADQYESDDDQSQTIVEVERNVIPSTQAKIFEIDTIKPESIMKRYERLKYELEELKKDVDLKGSGYTELKPSIDELLRNLETTGTKKRDYIQRDGPLNNLIQQIRTQKKGFNSSSIDELDNKMTYELVYNPILEPQSQKILQLSNRLQNLEKLIGTNVPLYPNNLISTLSKIDSHLTLLANPTVLEKTIQKIRESKAELESLVKMKKQIKIELGLARNERLPVEEMVSDDQKVDYVFKQLRKLDHVIGVIPGLISRLRTLKGLHSEAVEFSNLVSDLTEQQEVVLAMAKEIKNGMELLRVQIDKNQLVMIDNITSLDQRINDLIKN